MQDATDPRLRADGSEGSAGTALGEGPDPDHEGGLRRLDDAPEGPVAGLEERLPLARGELVRRAVPTGLLEERERASLADDLERAIRAG